MSATYSTDRSVELMFELKKVRVFISSVTS